MTEQITTRKMLELAAKAAGHQGHYNEIAETFKRTDSNGRHIEWWMPEHDDGDSKRLAVALRISVKALADYAVAEWYNDGGIYHCAAFADYGSEDEAWRYAVLSVAAKIGAQMQ